MNLLVSVIIPIYNASKYLEECLESVLNQKLINIEIICINDGSTDDSLEILKRFQKKDSRIIIIDQTNHGVSSARNSGLKIASGKYVGFVDGDDTVLPEFFQKLTQEAEQTNVDIVYTSFSLKQELKFQGVINREKILKEVLPKFFMEDSYNSVCIKLYRNDILKGNNVKFPLGIKNGEDAQFNIEFLMVADKISFLDYCGYHYREVEGSATRNIDAHDYLKRIVEVYKTDWQSIVGDTIPEGKLLGLKKIRFINSIISLIYICANRGNSFTDKQRILRLAEIVKHNQVEKVFNEKEMIGKMKLSSYSAVIFRYIRRRNVYILYLLTQYSYYRNKMV